MKQEIIELLEKLIEDSRNEWSSHSDENLGIDSCADEIVNLKQY